MNWWMKRKVLSMDEVLSIVSDAAGGLYRCIVAGGAPRDIILGAKPLDYDVFVWPIDSSQSDNHIASLVSPALRIVSAMEEEGYETVVRPRTASMLTDSDMQVTQFSNDNDMDVDVIIFRRPISPEEIIGRFDWDICMAWYDGELHGESLVRKIQRRLAIRLNRESKPFDPFKSLIRGLEFGRRYGVHMRQEDGIFLAKAIAESWSSATTQEGPLVGLSQASLAAAHAWYTKKINRTLGGPNEPVGTV